MTTKKMTVETMAASDTSHTSSQLSHSSRGAGVASNDKGEITAMHAAAVNGDRSVLAKLLSSSPRDVNAGDKFGRTPLMYCVLGDRLECAEMLVKAGANVNQRDNGGRTALHWAAHKGNYRCLKLLLSKGASWKEKDHEGQTAMHLSTRHKSPKCLALLMKQLELGEVDDQDKNKRTALHWAASYGNLEHVKMLIKQDSNIGIPDVDGKTPLHWAASSKDGQAVDCVKLILETAPSVINWQDFEGRTALHLAVADGNQAVVEALVSLEKCNVSALDNMFRTPLHWAAVLGYSVITDILLEGGADYASSDSNGATPLHYAAQNNFADTVEVFIKKQGVKDEPDLEGRTAFMWAAGKGADDVLHMFLKHKVDINQTDKNGGTALHAAALAGHASTVELLLKFKAQMDAFDLLKHTPLFRACEMGHMEVVQALIDNGAGVDVTDQDGRSPLHWAALGGHAYICQTLIKFGIDPNVRDQSGRSPLQCAAYGGFVNCMSVLIEHKADPNAQDLEGMTALHWACSKGHMDAVKLLIEFHAFPNNMEFTEDRYTPLDYALMGEHYEVAQYMVEQGALSITGIQDIAALKIQAVFRGYRVRKTFLERKKLLMKHEQLRKDAAKKKEEEIKRRESLRTETPVHNASRFHSSEFDHIPDVVSPSESGAANTSTVPQEIKEDQPASNVTESKEEDASKQQQAADAPVYKFRKKFRGPILTEDEKLLKQQKEYNAVVNEERGRLKEHRRKVWAATIIQRTWRNYHYLKKGIWKEVKESIREKRLKAGEEEWQRQIAALTIQLAWRKYYRKKLLKSLTPKNRKILHMWDPEVVAAKQRALVEAIYNEQVNVPHWYPKLQPAKRPTWMKYVPSPAAMSFNFALHEYMPAHGKKSWTSWSEADDFGTLKMSTTLKPNKFSYNYQES